MKNNTNSTLLAAAALAGLFAGSLPSTAGAAITSPNGQQVSPGVVADDKKGETHECASKNGCKGKGGCKTGDNGCAGKNSCKGKGGCAMKDGKPAKK